jgi:hypothetical protein
MDLNIRNVPESLMRLLKLEAAERSMTLRDNVIRKLTGIPSKAELDGMGFDIPEGATVSGYEESEEIEASRRRAAWWADRLKMQGTDPNPDPRTNPDRHDILDQAIAIAPPGTIAVELRGGEYGDHLIERRDIVIQALRDVCAGKRLSIPAEVGPMDKSRPAHDPKTCRVYKCGMCSK